MIEAMDILALYVIGTFILGLVVKIGFDKLLEYGVKEEEA